MLYKNHSYLMLHLKILDIARIFSVHVNWSATPFDGLRIFEENCLFRQLAIFFLCKVQLFAVWPRVPGAHHLIFSISFFYSRVYYLITWPSQKRFQMEPSTSSPNQFDCCVCHCRLELHNSLRGNKDLETGSEDDPILSAVQVDWILLI